MDVHVAWIEARTIITTLCGLLIWIDARQCLGRMPDDGPPRSAVVCGPNALLMFLTLCGRPVEGRLTAEIECGPQGASLLQLCKACDSIGFKTEIRRYQPDDFDLMALPAIVQFVSPGGHHFFVVYHVTVDTIDVLDGTTGERIFIPRARAARTLTGFALVPKRSLFERLVVATSTSRQLGWALLATNVFFALRMATLHYRRLHAKAIASIRAPG
ncbi:MAG TPA: cysteine peptidase family C39 domain-containing protein [Planctomycetaceae bacterium]|nr:cysteine peptidase family C39 domain-containing protein [Planctomycetaceae bacterium]